MRLLGAFKCGHRLAVREYIDEEFSFELLSRMEKGDEKAKDALEWIAKYNNEYYKGFLKKGDKSAIHNTPKLYKETTDAQNAKRRDIIGAIRSGKLGEEAVLLHLEDFKDSYLDEHNYKKPRDLRHEEHILELLDQKDEGAA